MAVAILAGIGVVLALAFLGRSQTAPDEELEPVPATGSGA
jgi:hypothetical protein